MCISVFCLNGLEEYQKICAREGRICAIKEINVTFIEKLLRMAQTCNRLLSQFETKHHLPFSLPLTAEMGNESARFRSFLKINPVYLQRLNIPALYQAGFYYAEHLDSIRCYYCDTKVRNWKEQYCNDDMFREHALENPSCLHLVLTKGLPFVEATVKSESLSSLMMLRRKAFVIPRYRLSLIHDSLLLLLESNRAIKHSFIIGI
ncbi:baculoviral IAP repeat-containing protein 2-like isoform X1 [Dreissena polymorpha]|uniref:baculoviral IAP repeat-containing protein 2-like isoform X1 n=1 Tax=Dreissena polymorpha TaxID=45954 RepID=UPI00226514A5|nr:baculoviral IAP repeat-containing protein 2-like isoform X1 [Dreissena polymorpha]